MNPTSKLITAFLLLTALAGLHASAQEAAGSPARYFRVIPITGEAPGLNYALEEKDVPVEVYSGTRSVFYRFQGSGMLPFYQLGKDAEGKVTRTIVAEADISAAGRLPLIFLSENRDKPGSYQTRVLRDDLEAFPGGSLEVINLAGAPMQLSVGTRKLDVAAGEAKVTRGTDSPGSPTTLVRVTAGDGRPNPQVYSNNWALGADSRAIVLINTVEPATTGRPQIQVRRIVESTMFPDPDPKKAQASAGR